MRRTINFGYEKLFERIAMAQGLEKMKVRNGENWKKEKKIPSITSYEKEFYAKVNKKSQWRKIVKKVEVLIAE